MRKIVKILKHYNQTVVLKSQELLIITIAEYLNSHIKP